MNQYSKEIAALADVTFAVLDADEREVMKTGFFITVDGWALTCAHGTRVVGEQVKLQRTDSDDTISAIVRYASIKYDVAVLEAPNMKIGARLPMSREWHTDERVLSLGFQWRNQVKDPVPLQLKTPPLKRLWEVVLKDETRKCMGLEPRQPGSPNVQPGTSGAAVLREHDQQLIGVVIGAPGELEPAYYDGKFHVPNDYLRYGWAMSLDQVRFDDLKELDALLDDPGIESMAEASRFLRQEQVAVPDVPQAAEPQADEADEDEAPWEPWLRPIDDWSDDDLQEVIQTFRTRRPDLPQELVGALWRYWKALRPGAPLLLDDEESEVALLLHARAYGLDVPEPPPAASGQPPESAPESAPASGHDAYCAALLARHRHQFQRPVTPSELKWGPRGVLAKEVHAALDSPVLDAWVLSRRDRIGAAIEQVLIVGRGVPQLRSWVFSEMLQTSLRIQTRTEPTEDIFAGGIMRIIAPSAVRPLQLPYPVLGTGGAPLDHSAAEDVQGELNRLVGQLEIIARQTGLVRVQRRDLNDQDVGRRLGAIAESSTDDTVRICRQPEGSDVVDVVDYARIPEGAQFLRFSGDLLRTRPFTRLLREFAYSQLKRVLMDLIARWDMYQQRELEHLQEKKEWDSDWQEAKDLGIDPAEFCVGKRSPTVTLETRFDANVGKAIRISPVELATDRWYEENLPQLISSYTRWRSDMERHATDYVKVAGVPVGAPPRDQRAEQARQQRWAPKPETGHDADEAGEQHRRASDHADKMSRWFTRLYEEIKDADIQNWHMGTAFMRSMISQLIDAAVRGRQLDNRSDVAAAFDAWQQEIQPLFWLEWRAQLRRQFADGRDPEEFFSRQTFFQTLVGTSDAGEIDFWLMLPKAVVDSHRSIVVFDRLQGVMEVRDATDYAESIVVEEKTNKKIAKKSLNRLRTSSVEECTESLLKSLRRAPADVSAAFLNYFVGEVGAAGASEKRLQARHDEALQATNSSWGAYTAVRAYSLGAYHSSRRCLKVLIQQAAAESDNRQLAGLYLFQSAIECFAHGLSADEIQEQLPEIAEGHVRLNHIGEVEQAFAKAQRADPDYVKVRLETLRKWGVHAVIRQILRDLSARSDRAHDESQAALLGSQAVEAMLTSLELQAVAAKLSEAGESGPGVLLKTGAAIEKGLLPRYSQNSVDILMDLHDILTGREAPRLGRGD